MEVDSRVYARYLLEEDALETWRKHACLTKISGSRREAIYEAAHPFFLEAARILVQQFSWTSIPHQPNVLFTIQPPTTLSPGDVLSLPTTFRALFDHARPCERMFESLFQVLVDETDCRLYVAEPLADLFHLLQLLAPGCFSLVRAEHLTHEVDDSGEVAWITWLTYVRALPPVAWMDRHTRDSPQLVAIFGNARWAALQRAAKDSEVLAVPDITFN